MEKKMHRPYRPFIIFTLVAVAGIIGFGLGYWTRTPATRLGAATASPGPSAFPLRPILQQLRSASAKEKYHFIHPLLACEVAEGRGMRQFQTLKKEVTTLIDELARHNDISTTSIYFDTRDGQWFGFNTHHEYYPASLLKVPLMMAYFKAAESDPGLLNKKLLFTPELASDDRQFFPPPNPLQTGLEYTIETLIERMIRYSDNDATNILLDSAPNWRSVADVFVDLDTPLPPAVQTVDFMSVKSYARFFRVLYNASYLNRDMSEKALNLLTTVDFYNGLRAPVPSTTPVAHKFGERTLAGQDNTPDSLQEFHDCGVVYHPRQPYLLCIMTKGADIQRLNAAVEKISGVVFNYIEKNY